MSTQKPGALFVLTDNILTAGAARTRHSLRPLSLAFAGTTICMWPHHARHC